MHITGVWAAFFQVAMHIGGALISVTIGMRHGGLAVFAKDMRRERSIMKNLMIFAPMFDVLFGLESPFESWVGIRQ